MTYTVIISTYNRADSLYTVLRSLEDMEIAPDLNWELILADNNCTDHTYDIFVEFCRRGRIPIRYIFEKNQGKSFALNSAISMAKGDIIVFTDDDVTVNRYWLEQIRDTFEKFQCSCIGGKIVPVWTVEKPSWLESEGRYRIMEVIVKFDQGEELCELHIPPFGANMAINRAMFEKYGRFRTDLGPTAKRLMRGEDTEFCRRLLQAGEKLIYSPKVIVYHPVEEQRTKKKYFQSWYFHYGRLSIVIGGIPQNAVCYYGIPRYLFRELLENCLRWVFNWNLKKRFYFKLRTYETIGGITESFRYRH